MIGRREQNKLDKRKRIVEATIALLSEKGFDQMTTREIATRAKVGTGTLFRYGHDKLDLCIMSITDERDSQTDVFEDLDDDATLLEQIQSYFEKRFHFWARHPEVSRLATYKMDSPNGTGPELARASKRQIKTRARLERIIRREQSMGRLKADADPTILSQMVFYIYVGTLRNWLTAAQPKPGVAVRKFMKIVTAAMEGSLESSAKRTRGRGQPR